MEATAAIMREFNKPLSLERVDIPPLTPGQVLVEVGAAGVCGSDVHMWRGRDPRTPLPIILGHEGVGHVAEVKGCKENIYGQPVAPGDLVLWERGVTCGRCYFCAVLHQPALCAQRWVYGIYRSFATPPHLNGCYATHIILDEKTYVIPLGDCQDPSLYVSASCSGATAAHGFELSPAHVGDTVVIFGPGPLGIFSLLLAKAAGAESVVMIGGTASRLELCQQLGATSTLNRHGTSENERNEAVRELTQGRGADLVIEASGSTDAAREGLNLVRHGGALSLVGFGTPVGEMTLAPFESLVRKNVRIQGVWVSDVSHTLQAISLVQQQPAALAHLVTHRLPLHKASRALELVADRQAMKAVLLPGGSPE